MKKVENSGGILESNDVVARLHVGDTLADGFDDTSALMTKNNGECAFGVLARECVGIYLELIIFDRYGSKCHLDSSTIPRGDR